MNTYTCPSCGTPLSVRGKQSVVVVCTSCHNTLERTDVDLKLLGVVAEVPEDLSPFQLYTEGKLEGNTFTLIGRVKQGWQKGFWNEWYVFVDDGRYGWLAEAQGELFLLWHQPEGKLPKDLAALRKQLVAGRVVEIDGVQWRVLEARETSIIGLEGELPYSLTLGSKGYAIDLVAPGGLFATLDFRTGGKAADWFVGHHYHFDQLHFSNLRELEGWRF